MRIRNLSNGGFMSVDDELAARLVETSDWEPADAVREPVKAPARRGRKPAVKEAD